jgi:hypothetical protein
MTFADFSTALASGKTPPAGLSPAVLALWHDAKGDWEAAHTAAQNDPGRDGAWVHAYLHRKEGDRGNAAYWYNRAGRATPAVNADLGAEWAEIAAELVRKQ